MLIIDSRYIITHSKGLGLDETLSFIIMTKKIEVLFVLFYLYFDSNVNVSSVLFLSV